MTRNDKLTLKQAAALAGVTLRTARRWVSAAKLKPRYRTPSGSPRFDARDVLRRVS